MKTYKCQPGVMRRCEIHSADGCDGTYNGAECECAADNQAYMPSTEREELKAYRALGTIEELSALVKAWAEGRVVVLPCKAGDNVYTLFSNEVIEKRIGRFIINGYTAPMLWVELDCDFLSSVTERWDVGLGTKFFFTRAEAEAARFTEEGADNG